MPTMPTRLLGQFLRWRARLRHSGPVAAALVGLALLVTACSSGPPQPGVAHVGPTPTASSPSSQSGGSPQDSPIAFSACMRAHGVPKFPDLNSQGEIQINPSMGIDPNSPQFQAAQRACQKLRKGGPPPSPAMIAQARAQMLRFSACMRAHGVPNYPDPTFSGNTVSMMLPRGIDPRSPQFQAAQRTCRSSMPGPKGGPGGGTFIQSIDSGGPSK